MPGPFRLLLALIRFILFLLLSIIMISIILLVNILLGKDMDRAIWQRKIYTKVVLWMLGVHIQYRGELPSGASMIVSNHRSYLDPFPKLTLLRAVPIAKSELASWPIIGLGAELSGIIFLERGNKSNRRHTRQVIADTIKSGFNVINYVEGTTHKKLQTIDFKPGSFIMASEEGLAITPAAIDYKSLEAAWVGDDTFVPHFIRCFGHWRMEVKISFGASIRSEDPHFLIERAKNFIDQELLIFREEWETSELPITSNR
ncbi:MAG: lysophospholipid acyltransferase family protein [Bacteroidota bacterium]